MWRKLMPPVIRIPDHVYFRLQQHATPFVDTPAIVVERLLDYYDEHTRGAMTARPASAEPRATEFDPHDPPDLRHTRVLEATLGTTAVRKWNELLQAAHRAAAERGHDLDAIRRMTLTNICSGERTDRGFVYLADIGLSIQNVDASNAWKQTLHLAEQLNLPVRVNFEWREKEGAARPGETGSLRSDSDRD
jgi:hypothetical protein